MKKNDLIYDLDGKDQSALYEVQGQYASDHDSDDSNRESADENDYPDESDGEDYNCGYN